MKFTSDTLHFPPVPVGEMAFALTVFVEAATRRILPRVSPDIALTQEGHETCKELYRTLCADIRSFPARGR